MLGLGPRQFGRLSQPTEDVTLSNITWVHFSGSAAIAGQENTSSMTDNGAGDFTITWTRPFATASSYAVTLCSSVANPLAGTLGTFDALQTIAAGSARTSFLNYTAAAPTDPTLIFMIAIGEF